MDIADVWLGGERPSVVTDVSKTVNSLFHNLKTRFYAEVFAELTGLTVEAWEASADTLKRLE